MELYKRIFKVLLKDYDDNMDFMNSSCDRAQESQMGGRSITPDEEMRL